MRFIFILTLFFAPMFSFASLDLISETYQGESTEAGRSQARKEIFNDAIAETSMKYIKQIIGEAKADRNKTIIENKVIKNSGKYIRFIKGKNFKKEKDKNSMEVELKLSLESLKALLLAQGLLYKLQGPPKVLPLISIQDRVNSKSYEWWAQNYTSDKRFIMNKVKDFHESIKESFKEKGFYGLSPIQGRFSKTVPEVYQTPQMKSTDSLFLGEFFKSSIILKGYIRFRADRIQDKVYHVDVNLVAAQSTNGRIIGEVVRTYATAPGTFAGAISKKMKEVNEKISEDLTVQLYDAWQRGTFGANLFKLTINGMMPFNDVERIKEAILLKVSDIKSLRERLISKEGYVFEMDSSVNPKALSDAIKKQTFDGFNVSVTEVRTDGLSIEVKKL